MANPSVDTDLAGRNEQREWLREHIDRAVSEADERGLIGHERERFLAMAGIVEKNEPTLWAITQDGQSLWRHGGYYEVSSTGVVC